MNQEELRKKLIEVVNFGLKVNAISERTKINSVDLSRFKNGHIYLKKDDSEMLEKFLDQISNSIS